MSHIYPHFHYQFEKFAGEREAFSPSFAPVESTMVPMNDEELPPPPPEHAEHMFLPPFADDVCINFFCFNSALLGVGLVTWICFCRRITCLPLFRLAHKIITRKGKLGNATLYCALVCLSSHLTISIICFCRHSPITCVFY